MPKKIKYNVYIGRNSVMARWHFLKEFSSTQLIQAQEYSKTINHGVIMKIVNGKAERLP